MVDTERLKALLAAATPGTWEAGLHSLHEEGSEYGDYSEIFNGNQTIVGYFPKYDVELCAALHNAAPDLIAEVEAAREALKAAKAALGKLDRYSTCTHLDMGGKHKYHIQVPYQTEIVEASKQALSAIAAYEEKHHGKPTL